MTTHCAAPLAEALDAVMFENWLRFYFIAEEGDELVLRLPEKAMEQIRKRYGKYHELAEVLNNAPIDHNTSLKAVCMFMAGSLNNTAAPQAAAESLFDNPAFHVELQLFGSWVQSHEEQLDASFLEFSDWKTMYGQWRELDEVKKLAGQLAGHIAAAEAEPSATVQ